MESADRHALPSDCTIRLVAAAAFLATKLEAHHGRGPSDFRFSHDLEDLMAVLDGRASLLEESRQSPPELQSYLAQQFTTLLSRADFIDALPSFLPADPASQQRLPEVEWIMRSLAALTPG
ncbi:MAG: hypothetical protein ACRC1L_13405 [Prochlorococcaceae cyanobacterium]